MRDDSPTPSSTAPEPSVDLTTRRVLLSVLAALTVGILLVLGLFYRMGSDDARNRAYQQLEAVAHAKQHSLLTWRAGHLEDASFLQNPLLIEGSLENTLSGRATVAERNAASNALLRMITARKLKAVMLLDTNGHTLLSTSREAILYESAFRQLPSIATAGHSVLTDVQIDHDAEPVLDIVTPLSARDGKPLGFIVSRLSLWNAARSIVTPWPGNSASSEALLLFSREDRPLLLTPRRFVDGDKVASLARPIDDAISLIAGAAGKIQRIENTDYRGHRALAVAHPIEGTPWVLLVKVDLDEALADVYRQLMFLLAGSLLLIVLTSLAVLRLWNIQTARDRKRLGDEITRRELLHTLELRLNDAQSFGRLGSWERDLRTGQVWWSAGMYALTGHTPPTAVDNDGQPANADPALQHYVHAADRARYDAAFSVHPAAGQRGSADVRIVTASGDIRQVRHQWNTIRNDNGEPVLRRGVTQDITEQLQAEASLREQFDMLKTLVDNVPGGVTLFDAELRLRFYNQQYKTLLDFPDDLFLSPTPDFETFARYNAWRGEYGPGDPEAQTQEAVELARHPVRRVIERDRPDGSSIEVRDAPLKDGGFVTITTDISARKKSEHQLRLSDKIIASSPTAILITDPGNKIVFVNPAFTAITGFASDEVQGKDPRVFSSGRHDKTFYRDFWRSIEATDHWSGEIWDRRRDGSVYPKWLSVHVLRNDKGRLTNYVGMFADITERKQAEQRIAHLAHHDPLTGLANRMSLQSRFEQALVDARRNNRELALIFIDLDRFKMINDSLGHQIGDLLLIEVAGRLSERLRESDVIARLGGDEFVVVLPEIPGVAHAALVARSLLEELARPIATPGRVLHTSGSIGIAVFPQDGETVDALMQKADTAMYESKAAGRNQFRFFTQEMSVSANDRLKIENDLRTALAHHQFELHYQPQVTPGDGRIVGVEALLRWAHPGGMIGPDRFIPIAEETGLIVEIGAWVLQEACCQAKRLKAAGHPVRMSVNLSARQLRSNNLLAMIRGALVECELAAEMLELEITESALMDSPEEAVAILRAIRDLGVSIALDDFGTGYSSLAYLKRFPITCLKIDRSFVCDLDTDPNDRAIALSTIALAHSLGLKVVAEGVETASQRDFLHQHGCDEAQGWFYAKALPSSLLDDTLARGTLP